MEDKGEAKQPLILSDFMREFEGLESPDEKLRFAMEGMRSALAQEGTANFKAFWDIRALCTELFKEAVNPALRAHYWNEYRELSSEARRLKDLLNQESTFACEQMEGAIAGLEREIASLEAGEAKGEVLTPVEGAAVVQRRFAQYAEIQSELSLLNAYAARIQALRKELIPLEIRVRHKNKFFERLSALGDRVYPRRKELMCQVSDLFLEDVASFVDRNFAESKPHAPLYQLRDEIKALQGFAKQITLTTNAFSESRKRLSECWDLLREAGRQRKAEHAEKRGLFRENLDQLLKRLDELSQQVDNPAIASEESSRHLDEIMREMKETDLGPQERTDFRDKMGGVRQKLFTRVKGEEGERKRQERERREERAQQMTQLGEQLTQLAENPQRAGLEQVEGELVQLQLTSAERQEIERRLADVRDRVIDAEEAQLLEGDHSPAELESALERLRGRRREVKERFEELRKAGGSSGLDFEQAMAYREAIDRDRMRIEQLDEQIGALEERLNK